jgi:hypothetical protein
MVKSYLYQHANSLGWAKDKLNFNNPKDKGSHNKREPVDSKRKRPSPKGDTARDAKSKRPKTNTSKVPTRDQCRRKLCREKGNHVNHSHQDCRFKTNDRAAPSDNKRQEGARHPNLGLAPPKKARITKLVTSAVGSANKQETRTCYICNKPGHIAPNCPDKVANKQNANKKLFTNKNFMVLWQETWDDQDEQDCAAQVLEAWGDDNLCPTCHKEFSFSHRCDPEDRHISTHFQKVKAKLRQSPLRESGSRPVVHGSSYRPAYRFAPALYYDSHTALYSE